MPNIQSAKKALRQSERKKAHNLFWRRRIRGAMRDLKKSLDTKNVDIAILKKEESLLQKVLDKATKAHVVHKNKASRLKSRYARRIAALQTKTTGANKGTATLKSKSKSS